MLVHTEKFMSSKPRKKVPEYISTYTVYGCYFRVGVIFAKTKARKTRKLPQRENFHIYSIPVVYTKEKARFFHQNLCFLLCNDHTMIVKLCSDFIISIITTCIITLFIVANFILYHYLSYNILYTS